MYSLFETLKNLHDSGHLQQLVRAGGVPLIAAIVFAETGLLVGFFLPGDTMLFVAGVAAATAAPNGQNYLNIWELTFALIAAGIAGDQLGYFLGNKTGHAIFTRKEGRFFKRRYAENAHELCVKYGVNAVIIAKFLPVLRTFVPFMAGVGEMPYRKYLVIDSLAVVAWIFIVVWSGYLLGDVAQDYLHYIVPAIAFFTMLPVAIGIFRAIMLSRKSSS